jgi:hypothetical protein
MIEPSLEHALLGVWRQALVESLQFVRLGSKTYVVKHTPKTGLCQIDFEFDGKSFRGLEQNPGTKSRWAKLARSGKKVMQFLSDGRYAANVVDGKVTLYARSAQGWNEPLTRG